MKEVGVILHYPKLLDNNYGMWATKMKIFLRAQGVWVVVVNKVGVDAKMDQMALAVVVVQTVRETIAMISSEHETTLRRRGTLSRR